MLGQHYFQKYESEYNILKILFEHYNNLKNELLWSPSHFMVTLSTLLDLDGGSAQQQQLIVDGSL